MEFCQILLLLILLRAKTLLGYLLGSELSLTQSLNFLDQTNNVVYVCVDQTRPILTLDTSTLKEAFLRVKGRGVKVRYITEITKDNLPYCKQPLTVVRELRHLDGFKGIYT